MGVHQVVVNGRRQYSLWPSGRRLPSGWSPAGFRGDRQACLAHIEEQWTDMRPLAV
ncbi:MbtH family NRPS accessory protein [Actinomadura sp. DC4]|nr:MbtH family NRPS accessory protein [Actinomadura sp. DC4]MDN3356799.1 MbtH family NRPS accessory protein [Actinomadura sp. DC4]